MDNAIIILSGGIDSNGGLPSFVANRIEKAIQIKTQNDYIVTATRTTVYKAPPRDEKDYPLDDAVVYAKMLVEKGIKREHVRIENCSFETLGSAYFLRMLHINPLNLKKFTVITSEFHMPRTKCVFDWIFSLPFSQCEKSISEKYNIAYIGTENIGIEKEVLEERIKKEQEGIERINLLKNEIHDLEEFNQWLFRDHSAYSVGLPMYKISQSARKTY